MSPGNLMLALDALGLWVRLFSCTDGSIGAEIPTADIKTEHTVNSLTGYGETPDEAVHALWQAVLDIDTGRDWLRIKAPGSPPRYYRWNGAAWKEKPPESAPAVLDQMMGARS